MKENLTIEETAEIFYCEQSKAYEDAIEPMFDNSRYLVAGFIDGAKWQQEQYYNETFKTTGTMNERLIKIKDYVLIVNDEDIKEGDFQINHLTNKVSKRTDNWLQASKENCSKIIAHLPLDGAPYLEGIKLLKPQEQ
jgi:hypothetical protein